MFADLKCSPIVFRHTHSISNTEKRNEGGMWYEDYQTIGMSRIPSLIGISTYSEEGI